MNDISMIKLSFIISVFNSEKYVRKMLSSLLNQTDRRFCVIVCDDGSTDSSFDVLKTFCIDFDKYNIPYQLIRKDNGGVSSAVNAMLPLVKTDYFISCDSDDWYDCNVVEEFYCLLEKVKYFSLAAMSVRFFRENGQLKRIQSFSVEDENINLFERFVDAKSIPCFTGIFIYNLRVFEESNGSRRIFNSRYGQNWQLILPIVKDHTILLLNNVFYNYLSRYESLSHLRNTDKEYELLYGYSQILDNVLGKLGCEELRTRKKIEFNTKLCNVCFKSKKRTAFFKHYPLAKKSFKLFIKKVVLIMMIWKK